MNVLRNFQVMGLKRMHKILRIQQTVQLIFRVDGKVSPVAITLLLSSINVQNRSLYDS